MSSEYEPLIASGINRINSFGNITREAGNEVAVLTAAASIYGLQSDKKLDADRNVIRASGIPRSLGRFLRTRYLPVERWLNRPDSYYHWVPFAKHLGRAVIQRRKIDTVISSFPNYSSLEVGCYLSKQTDVDLIVDFRDPPWFLNPGKSFDKSTKVYKIIQNCLSKAAAIISATENTKLELEENFQFGAPVMVIANGYDKELVDALPDNDQESDERFSIVHIGSFYDEGRDLTRIVQALNCFQKELGSTRQLALTCIGDSPEREVVAKLTTLGGHIDIKFEAPCSNQEALARAKKADALLLLQGDFFYRQIPAKAYEYLALQRPIWAVIGNKGATKRFLSRYPSNVVFADYDQPEEIKSSLQSLLSMNPVPTDVSHMSRQCESRKLLQVLESL